MDGMVKVGDFGLVTALEEERDDEMDSLRNRSSRHTDQVGTKLYMSPEQVSDLLTISTIQNATM